MTASQFVLPEPRLAPLKAALRERLARAGASVQPENFRRLLDPLMREALEQGFREATAHEGTVWLLDPEGTHLVPAFNNGPNAEKFVGRFRQPIQEGLICMVFANEQPFLENEVFQNARQSKLLDGLLGLKTCALAAVPFYLFNSCRGVISAVQLQAGNDPNPPPPGFQPQHLSGLGRASEILSRLVEWRLMHDTMGLGASE